MAEYKTREQKRKFYDSGSWKRLRKHIRNRDNNECQECKRQGKVFIDTNQYSEKAKRKKIQLIVDHIKELEDYPELALDEENLETLCVYCHNKKHGRVWRYFKRPEPKWNDERW